MKFQIGKSGVSDGVIESLKLAFKNNKLVRISVLKNYAPTKDKVREVAEDISKRIGTGFRYSVIGFTIILRRGKIAST